MSQSLRQIIQDTRGAAIVELSFSLMLFLFVAFGVIEVGAIVNERNALTQVAREGASLASRNLTSSLNMLALLESTENALHFSTQPNSYRIYLAQITAGNVGNPAPTCNLTQAGGLSNSVQAPVAPQCDLPGNLVNLVTYDPALGTAPVQQFTVVKVYYQHNPITPFGNLTWFGGGNGNAPTVMFSEAIF